MNLKQFILSTALLAASMSPLRAAEYFVTKQGNDASNGTNKQTAFLTVKKGVDALQPGDTLTIGRGEYFESVTRDGLGNMDAQTIIRAEIPGTVLLRGDVELPSSAFKKVEGYRYIYVAAFDREVQAINETDSLTRMPIFADMRELEFIPGTSYYDAEKKLLYISTSDLRPPSTHHYTVSVIKGSGILLTNPRRVTVDGIAASGFQSSTLLPSNPSHFTTWGVYMDGARGCVIRNVVAYFNGSGIGFSSGDSRNKDGVENGWNLIEKCTAFSNGSKFFPEGGNVLGFTTNNDVIRDSYSYRGSPNGMRFYGAGIRGPGLMKNNLGWGSTYTDIFNKGGEVAKYVVTENSITVGILHSHNLKNSIVGTKNQYNEKPPADNINALFSEFVDQEKAKVNRDQWFADVENLDFRLQPGAPYRGKGPNGTDSGPFPYQPNIFYVSAGGNDTNDGLSTKKPWKTLAHAMKQLRAGDTLYLESGTYDAAGELKISNAEGRSTSIRGRGTSQIVIRGNIAVKESRGLEFERLNFTGALTFTDSRDIRINNCRFSNQSTPLAATNVQNLKVTHSEFTGFNQAALRLEKSTLVWLGGNIFDNKTAPAIQADNANAIQYSDYNSYANADNAWRVGGAALKLAALPDGQDKYSVVRAPEYSVENGLPVLQNAGLFDAGGPHGEGLGFYREYRKSPMSITTPVLHSASDTTANIEWWTSVPAQTEIAWGETPGTPNKLTYNENGRNELAGYHTLSLDGLKPNTKYYFRILSSKTLEQDIAQYTTPATPPKDALLSFQTAAAPAVARVLYVAPDGDDKNSGLSRAQAWRTVTKAGDMARPGDTILLAAGTYSESVRVGASGSAGSPITFKAAPGEKVIFDGNDRLIKTAFSLANKRYINFDGLYFQKFGDAGWRSIIDLSKCANIQITRCFLNANGKGTPGTLMRIANSTDILVENSVFTRGFQGIYITGGSDIIIKNNAFVNNLICPILSSDGPAKSLHVRNNIFVDSIPSKVKVHLFETGGFDRYVFENNAFYLRIPDEQRKPFFFYGTGPGRLSIADYEKRTGLKNIVVDDPGFIISNGQKPNDITGKPITFLGDWIPRADLDFDDVFSTRPELVAGKIGVQPEAFKDFHFQP